MEFVRALPAPSLSSRTDSASAGAIVLPPARARSARKSRALAYFILMMSRWHKRAEAAAMTSPGCCPTCGERMRDGAVFRPQRKVNWGLGCGRGCSACHCDRRLCPAWAVCPSICFGNQQSQTRPIMDIVVDNVDSGQRVHLDADAKPLSELVFLYCDGLFHFSNHLCRAIPLSATSKRLSSSRSHSSCSVRRRRVKGAAPPSLCKVNKRGLEEDGQQLLSPLARSFVLFALHRHRHAIDPTSFVVSFVKCAA